MREREGEASPTSTPSSSAKGEPKGIIIGKKGAMLKKVGSYAREDMERFFGCKVNLQLWVKVKEDWRNREAALRSFGLTKRFLVKPRSREGEPFSRLSGFRSPPTGSSQTKKRKSVRQLSMDFCVQRCSAVRRLSLKRSVRRARRGRGGGLCGKSVFETAFPWHENKIFAPGGFDRF